MSEVIAISNHKGGVGKTTSAINIGAGLNRLGKSILLVDLDPQANLTQGLGLKEQEPNIYGALRGLYPLRPVKVREGLDIVPSHLDLAGAEVELISEPGRDQILTELLRPYRLSKGGGYDYIIIDSPPSLGLLTLNALTAANKVLIPIQAEYFAMQGLTKLMDIIKKIQGRLNEGLVVGGIIITQYDNRLILKRNVVKAIEKHFSGKVFSTRIRNNIALSEAPLNGKDIFSYNPESNGAADYMALSQEILDLLPF